MTKTLTPVTEQRTKNGCNRRRDWYYSITTTKPETFILLHSFTLKGQTMKMKRTELGAGF